MGGFKQWTKQGYSVWEVISALQKAVRRSEEEEAMFWALELEESGFFPLMLNRLRVIAHEDIGIGDPRALLVSGRCIEDAEKFYQQKNKAWRLAIGNCILSLCRAKKSREADEFQGAIRYRRLKGWKPEIPDHALDFHTLRGRRMGRGAEQFIEEGTRLVPEPEPGRYREEFKKMVAVCVEEKLRGGTPEPVKSESEETLF